MENKKKLIGYLIDHPSDKRKILEDFINSEISDRDVLRVIREIEAYDDIFEVYEMYYSENGNFNLQIGRGVTWLKQ